MGPRHLPTSGGAAGKGGVAAFRAQEQAGAADGALVARIRKRLGKDKGAALSAKDQAYLVRQLKRADAVGERTVQLLLHLAEHATLEDPSGWREIFGALGTHDLAAAMPVEKTVAAVHELAGKLSQFGPLNKEAVAKLMALGTVRGVPNIRTRTALESVRRLHPMQKGAAAAFAAQLTALPFAPPKPWTFLVYMASENNLEPYAVDDLNAMERTFAKVAPFANVVVLADGGVLDEEDPDLGPAPERNWASRTRMLLIESDEGPGDGAVVSRAIPVPEDCDLGQLMKKDKGELNLGSGKTLKAALDFVQSGLPSDHFFLNVWSHGLAWKGIGEDQSHLAVGDMLRPHELQAALSDLKQPVDVMGFDACLMANSGVSLLLSELGVDHLIGSQELLDATGWGYDNVFNGIADAVVDGEVPDPAALAHTVVDVANATTISTVDLGRAKKIWAGLDDLGAALIAAGGRGNEDVQRIVEDMPRYGSYGVDAEDGLEDDEDLVDVIDLCQRLEARFQPDTDVAQAASALRALVKDATHHKNTPSESYPGIEARSYGLTTYLPRTADDFLPQYVGRGATWKKAAPSWIDFLKQPAAD